MKIPFYPRGLASEALRPVRFEMVERTRWLTLYGYRIQFQKITV